MLSTFARYLLIPREPRNQLQEGITTYYAYKINRHHSPPAHVTPDIPAAAPEFALQTLQFPADATQQEILASPARRVVLCCTRQWGKSTTGAIKALHHALVNAACLVLIASRTRRQAGELLEKIINFSKLLDIPYRRAPRHPDSLLLPNGSRIIALPGVPDSLRGFSAVSLLIVDEAAYVPDELYFALRPMLATTNGTVWLLSTPRNRNGFFYDEWSTEGNSWTKFKVTAPDCPRISEDFLDEERKLHGPALFKREYFCDFGYTGQSYFDLDALDAASGLERYQAAEQFSYGRPTSRFYVGFDVGQKANPSAAVVIERISGLTSRRDPVTFAWIPETHLIIRKIERFPLNVSYDSIVARLNRIVRDLGDPRDVTVLVDATGCGQPFLDILRKQRIGALILPIGITSGAVGSYASGIERVPKKDLMSNAGYVLMSQSLSGQPGMAGLKELRAEMEAFRVRTSRAGSDTFRSSHSDDLVMAFALAVWKTRCFIPRPAEAP